MPAYAKIALVTPVFHASDVAFARGWSRRAPGIGGWRVLLDDEAAPERIDVIPPAAEAPVFCITRQAAKTLLERVSAQAGASAVTVGVFDSLRQAVLALCPLPQEALEEIQEQLERAFPRSSRRR